MKHSNGRYADALTLGNRDLERGRRRSKGLTLSDVRILPPKAQRAETRG